MLALIPGNSALLKSKQIIADQTSNDGIKDVEKLAPVKYLSNFGGTLEMPPINCEINLILTWFSNWFIVAETANRQEPTFSITDPKLYVPIVTLSTQDNVKLSQQLKSGFQRTINWNKYQWKASIEVQNEYLDFQVDQIFSE